jgi:predicted RNA polymerase sigma factor
VVGGFELVSTWQRPAVRAQLFSQLGRHAEAADHYRQAAALTRNAGEPTTFLGRTDTEVALWVRDSGSGRSRPDKEFTQ